MDLDHTRSSEQAFSIDKKKTLNVWQTFEIPLDCENLSQTLVVQWVQASQLITTLDAWRKEEKGSSRHSTLSQQKCFAVSQTNLGTV